MRTLARIEQDTTSGRRKRDGETALILNATDVDTLLRTGHRRARRFVLVAPDLIASEREALQSDLNRLATECGCGIGSVLVVATLSIYSAYMMFWRSATVTAASIWMAIVFTLGSALLGKLIGRAHAGWKLHRILVGLRDQLLRGEALH